MQQSSLSVGPRRLKLSANEPWEVEPESRSNGQLTARLISTLFLFFYPLHSISFGRTMPSWTMCRVVVCSFGKKTSRSQQRERERERGRGRGSASSRPPIAEGRQRNQRKVGVKRQKSFWVWTPMIDINWLHLNRGFMAFYVSLPPVSSYITHANYWINQTEAVRQIQIPFLFRKRFKKHTITVDNVRSCIFWDPCETQASKNTVMNQWLLLNHFLKPICKNSFEVISSFYAELWFPWISLHFNL